MKNEILESLQNLKINNIKAIENDFSSFKTTQEISYWIETYWKLVEKLFDNNALDNATNIRNEKGIEDFLDVFGYEYHQNYETAFQTLQKKEELEKPLVVHNVAYKVIQIIDVLHCGWGSDDKAYLVSTEEGNRLVYSSYGVLNFYPKETLEEKIKEYKKALDNTQKILDKL